MDSRNYWQRRKNTSANLLIKRYADKQGGRVCEARKEIVQRFDYLDWNIQKRILYKFLDSCKTDRVWAYSKLLQFWDNCFEPLVKSLWEQYHEQKCSWVIIRHFPEVYLVENLNSLLFEGNYYFICKRLGNNPSFYIDRTKLKPLQYLSVVYSSGRIIEKNEALEALYELIGNHCSTDLPMLKIGLPIPLLRQRGFNPMDIRDVRRAVYYLDEMGYQETVDIFWKWCDNVANRIKTCEEYHDLLSQPVSDDEYILRLSDIAIVNMYIALPLSVMSKIK